MLRRCSVVDDPTGMQWEGAVKGCVVDSTEWQDTADRVLRWHGPTFNPRVQGSIPWWPTLFPQFSGLCGPCGARRGGCCSVGALVSASCRLGRSTAIRVSAGCPRIRHSSGPAGAKRSSRHPPARPSRARQPGRPAPLAPSTQPHADLPSPLSGVDPKRPRRRTRNQTHDGRTPPSEPNRGRGRARPTMNPARSTTGWREA